MNKRKMKLGVQQLRAGFVPTTFNEERNTIEVVWTTGSRVKRQPWFGEAYVEELSLKKSHVDLERLNNGAPLLNNHHSRDLNDVIGVVEKASLRSEDGERVGVATVKLSDREELRGIVQDIKNGIIRNISVGYRINKFEELKERVDDLPVFRAVDWTPMELSFVGIPADAGAQSRNEESTNECEIINQEGESMKTKKKNLQDDENTRGVPVAVDEEAESSSDESSESSSAAEESQEEESVEETSSEETQDDDASDAPSEESSESEESTEEEGERSESVQTGKADAETIRAAEMQRGLDIRNAVKVAKLDESLAEEFIKDGMSLDDVRKSIFEKMETETSKRTTNQRIEVKDMDQRKLRKEAAVRGILHAANPSSVKLENGDEQFRHASLIDTARNFLAAEGVNTSTMSKLEVAERALHTSSDFGAVLSDSCNKSLIEGYEEVPSTFELFTKSRVATDFKEITGYRLTTGGILETVNEHGEYPRGSVSEKSEKYRVKKHGEIIGNTYEMMVNDDLGAFTDIPRQLGQKAKRTENETFWALITGNQVMGDGIALFDAQHGNLGTAGVINIGNLGEIRKLMRRQLDEGKRRLNLMAKYLVVPAELETLADQFLSQIVPNNAGQANPFSGSMEKVVEPILDDSSVTAWYGFGSLQQGPMAEISRLGGNLPEIFMREGFDVDGMEMKIRHTFGMRIMDHRQFVKNEGA